MKAALLKGNRFNPWHMQVYTRIGECDVTCFRADSEIQRRFDARDEESPGLATESITLHGGDPTFMSRMAYRLGLSESDTPPLRVEPFHARLKDYSVIQTWELFTEWSDQAMEAQKRYGVPAAVMVWDNIPFNNEGSARMREVKARVREEARCFLVHTERSRRMLMIEGVAEDRIQTVPIGIDLDRFQPEVGNRNALGLPEDAYVVLFVGWLLPRKGLDYLIWAMADLAKRTDRPLHLHMIGSVGRPRIEALLQRAGGGFTHSITESVAHRDMPRYYAAADAFVLPSIATPTWQEQFGMALIEAMACGKPIVATRSGAIPEVAGEAARIVQPNDFMAISEALAEFIADPEVAQALGMKARVRAEECFGIEKAAAAMMAIYSGVVAT